MNPHDIYSDLHDGDPLTSYTIHQQYHTTTSYRPTISTAATYISIILCCLPLIYHLLYAFNYDIPPLPQILFDTIISLIPPRLLYSVEKYQQKNSESPAVVVVPQTHAAKREAMRRVLGMDKPGGIISAVGQVGARRLSVFQGFGGSRKSEAPMGLGNIDNSCYQNSILQGLASLDSFSKYLDGKKPEEQDVGEQEKNMGYALKELITDLVDPTNNGKRRWTPSILKNMNSVQQQDAQEYYSGVLDAIEKEKAKELAASLPSASLDIKKEPKPKVFDAQIPISDFRNPLEGMTGQRVSCKSCGYSDGLPLTPFNCLTVPLARLREQTLQSCLDEYTSLEFIEDMNCVKCTLLKFQALMTTLIDRTKEATEDRLKAAHEDAKIRLEAINQALEDDDYEDKTLREKCKIESRRQRLDKLSLRDLQSLWLYISIARYLMSTPGHLSRTTRNCGFQSILTYHLGVWGVRRLFRPQRRVM
jgi:ubiquitin carboxyl-terminal hydrolase 1